MNISSENGANTQKSEILISYSRLELKNMDFDPTKPEMYQNYKPQQPNLNNFPQQQNSNLAYKPQQPYQGQQFNNNITKTDNSPQLQVNKFQNQNQGFNKPIQQNNFFNQNNLKNDANQLSMPQYKQFNQQYQQNQFQFNQPTQQYTQNRFNQFNQNSNTPFSNWQK